MSEPTQPKGRETRRIDQIVDAVLGSQDLSSILPNENQYVTISPRDFLDRLVRLIDRADQAQQGLGAKLKQTFMQYKQQLGPINSLMLMGYIHNRLGQAVNSTENESIADIPKIVAEITNGNSEKRCMYAFIRLILDSKYDMPIEDIRKRAPEFAQEYRAQPVRLSDVEEANLKAYLDGSFNGSYRMLKRMIVMEQLGPALRRTLKGLRKVEDLELKEST